MLTPDELLKNRSRATAVCNVLCFLGTTSIHHKSETVLPVYSGLRLMAKHTTWAAAEGNAAHGRM